MRTLLILLFGFSLVSGFAQTDTLLADTSTVSVKNKKSVYASARKATILSAVVPGLGQIYNRKIWKAGVIYAGLGGLGYLFYINNANYNEYRSALIFSQEPGQNGAAYGYTTDQLSREKARFKKYRDYTVVGIGAIYLLNIVDANVDAHLKTFDVSDDLSLRIDPWQNIFNDGNGLRTANGISFKLTF